MSLNVHEHAGKTNSHLGRWVITQLTGKCAVVGDYLAFRGLGWGEAMYSGGSWSWRELRRGRNIS